MYIGIYSIHGVSGYEGHALQHEIGEEVLRRWIMNSTQGTCYPVPGTTENSIPDRKPGDSGFWTILHIKCPHYIYLDLKKGCPMEIPK